MAPITDIVKPAGSIRKTVKAEGLAFAMKPRKKKKSSDRVRRFERAKPHADVAVGYHAVHAWSEFHARLPDGVHGRSFALHHSLAFDESSVLRVARQIGF